MTETSSLFSANGGELYIDKPDSVGPVVAICDARIVAADGRDLPVGAVGELWARGPNVIPGYWNKPDANAVTFADGWLRTGDLARLDDDGCLYIVDRAKDVLIRGGENVYCVEVEDALYSHPAVMDAAVVGLDDRILGDQVAAVVQIKTGCTATAEELRQHVAQRLAAFKVPVYIQLRAQPLPRNANGKIMKRQLREELKQTPS
jgi:long-chain acyl-CoA synthetase